MGIGMVISKVLIVVSIVALVFLLGKTYSTFNNSTENEVKEVLACNVLVLVSVLLYLIVKIVLM